MSSEIYDRDIRALVEPGRDGEIVVIDLDTGAWEVDTSQDAASGRLEARHPHAQMMIVRVGSRFIRQFRSGPAEIAA